MTFSVYERITSISKKTINESYKIISELLIKDFQNGVFRTQKQIADDCYVSLSTITKFSKKLEVSGYRELVLRLKFEKEKTSPKPKQEESKTELALDNIDILKKIYRWIIKNQNWIDDFSNKIKIYNKITIFTSYQMIEATEFLEKILTSKNIIIKKIYAENDYLNFEKIVEKNELKLAIITGKDNNSLLNYYLKQFFSNDSSNNYLITSNENSSKLEQLKYEKKLILDFPSDNVFGYARKFLAIIILFEQIFERIKNI